MPAIITMRGFDVNTFRGGDESRNVNNGGMSLPMPLHLQIKRWREYRRMTQEQLAAACEWGQSRIGNYESASKANREPRLADLPVLAGALGITIDELFFGTPGLEGVSQPVRLDPERLKNASARLHADFAVAGFFLNLATELDLLALAYEAGIALSDERVSPAYAEALARRIEATQGELDEARKAGRPGPAPPVRSPTRSPQRSGR
jgi:transcriptional regulator with XRE-family HTH domain